MTSARPGFSSRSLWIGLAVVAVVGGSAWYFFGKNDADVSRQTKTDSTDQQTIPDPRISYRGPYLNVRPEVASVGSAKCAECHASIAETYSRHPMGKSILPVSKQPIGELADNAHTSISAFGSQFRIEHNGNLLQALETRQAQSGEPLYEMKIESNFAIGSGNKGYSFLTEQDGFVTQSPVSWYSQKQIWDGSPGFSPDLHAGRPIHHECLYCHANEVVPVKGTLNRYEQPLFHHGHSIGCERCHGPGAEHVRLHEANAATNLPDYSIVNPKHLEPALREAVCQQCHLEGEARIVRLDRSPSDFRPGLPLDSVMRVLVRDHRGEDRKAVNHVEQMFLSKCYVKSSGALGCITCHDPHEKAAPEKRAAQYHDACLKCHDCTSPIEVRRKLGSPDNCVGCHMPQFAANDVVHSATTDHRIVRNAIQSKIGASRSETSFLFFPSRQPDLLNPQECGDFAVGLVEMALKGKASGAATARTALLILERALSENPNDYRAWEAKSYVLRYAGRKPEALEAAQKVLAITPDDELALTHIAALAADSNLMDEARKYWQRAIAINPRNAIYRVELAAILGKSGDWVAARKEAEEAMRLDPALAGAHTVMAIADLHSGNRTKAEETFRTVTLLNPPNLNQLRKWYETERSSK